MSILLDALKRSEEQRQLGSTPGIHSPGPRWPATAAAAQQWIPITLMAFSAIAMAWIGWQQYRQPESLAVVAAEMTSTAFPATDQGAPVDMPPGGPSGGQPVATANGSRTPVETLRENSESTQGVSVQAPQEAQQTEPRKTQINESFTGFAAESGSGSSQPEATVPADPEVVSTLPTQEPEDSAGVVETQPHVAKPISYWELPQGIRDELPDMHISVLVYAESPADRFVLVSGQRMVEQDEFQEGIVLDEIRRDGAVFRYRKYRFLVKG